MNVQRRSLVYVALSLTIILAECTTRNLAFKVIDSTVTAPSMICDNDPSLTVIASLEEIPSSGLETYGYHNLLEQLRALDYSRQFAIAVCRGQIGARNPSLIPDIRQITRYGAQVAVKAHFQDATEILSKEGGEPADDLPYQLAVVTKKGRWGQDIRFVLYVNDEEILTQTHFIPTRSKL